MALILLSGCMMAMGRVGNRLDDQKSEPAPTVTGNAYAPLQVREEMEKVVKGGVSGVTAIVMRDGKLLYRMDVGKIGPDTQYPVASASKWMTAALVMKVVDDGKLSLDEPISKYLPEFQGEAGQVTLRQLLAQTSGQGSLKSLVDIRQDARLTLAQSAAEIAKRPLEDPPGKVFKYGGPGFQVAGAMVEAVTGRRWADLFDESIARPLGMTHTYWEHLPNRGVSPADTLNPLLQGGVVTTADDYLRFLTMLAQRGTYERPTDPVGGCGRGDGDGADLGQADGLPPAWCEEVHAIRTWQLVRDLGLRRKVHPGVERGRLRHLSLDRSRKRSLWNFLPERPLSPRRRRTDQSPRRGAGS